MTLQSTSTTGLTTTTTTTKTTLAAETSTNSKERTQFDRKQAPAADLGKCGGAASVQEIFDGDITKYKTYTGKPLSGSDPANPCGMIAKSLFNDTFALSRVSNDVEINVDETGIANAFDKRYMFNNAPNSEDVQWIDLDTNGYTLNRTFRCLDANGEFPQFQEALGQN